MNKKQRRNKEREYKQAQKFAEIRNREVRERQNIAREKRLEEERLLALEQEFNDLRLHMAAEQTVWLYEYELRIADTPKHEDVGSW